MYTFDDCFNRVVAGFFAGFALAALVCICVLSIAEYVGDVDLFTPPEEAYEVTVNGHVFHCAQEPKLRNDTAVLKDCKELFGQKARIYPVNSFESVQYVPEFGRVK